MSGLGPTFTSRMLNRLMNSPHLHRESSRPAVNDDKGYDELVRRLAEVIKRNGSKQQESKSEIIPLTNLIRFREFGRFQSTAAFMHKTQRSLIRNSNRKYAYKQQCKSQGMLAVAGHLLVSHKDLNVYDMERSVVLCRLNMLYDDEKICGTLLVELPVKLQPGELKGSPNWLIILTTFGRLLFVNPLTGIKKAEYILPADQYNFRSLQVNRDGYSFCVYGCVPPHSLTLDDWRRNICTGDYVIAIFDIYPLKYRGMFRLYKNIFGQVSNACAVNDILFVFRKKPYEILLYDLQQICRNYTEEVFRDGEGSDGSVVLPLSIIIREEPQVIDRIIGNYNSVEYAGIPYHMLAIPASDKGTYLLKHAGLNGGETTLNIPFSLKVPENHSLRIEGQCIAALMFHANESGRMLHIDGPALVSYAMNRVDGNTTGFSEQWRTDLWVHHDVLQGQNGVEIISRSGRRIRPATDISNVDYRMQIKDVDFEFDCGVIIVLALCDLNSPVFDDPEKPFMGIYRRNIYADDCVLCAVVFLLDDTTGDILRIAMMRTSVIESASLSCSLLGDGIVFTQSFSKRHKASYVEIQSLQENDIWNVGSEKAVDRQEQGPSTNDQVNHQPLSSRARRLIRRSVLRENYQRFLNHRDPMSSRSPGSADTGRGNENVARDRSPHDAPQTAGRRGHPRLSYRRRYADETVFSDDEDDEDYVPPGGAD